MSTIQERRKSVVTPGERNYKGIGPSHLSTFASCPQRAAFQYEAHLEPVGDTKREPARIGELVHVGLAYRYGAMLPQRPGWMVYPSPAEAIAAVGAERPDLTLQAQRIFAWYEYVYQKENVVPVLVEAVLNAPLEEEWVAARVDFVGWIDGILTVADHKVQKTLHKATASIMSTDRQMLTILAAARANGYDVQRVMLNGMTRDYPEPKFRRFDVQISHDAYGRLGQDTLYYLRQRRVMRDMYPDPYNRPRNFDACMTRFGLCPFHKLCRDGLHRLNEFEQC